MNLIVDLNADLGEGAGHDKELFKLISSANIATGFHAGDSDSMHAAVSAAKKLGVAVGAHPSFFDRENFGRKELKVSNQEVFDAVVYQLGVFQAIASAVGVQPNHVKPHGALYNMAVRDDKLADASDMISEAVAPGTIQVPPSGKPILLLGDCQTIGGYPKMAHVITVDFSVAAQLRAGDRVRFSEVSLADAYRLLLERERQLELFRVGLSLHTS